MDGDDLKELFSGLLVIACFCALTAVGCEVKNAVGHQQLGSKGHVCFANHTCRGNLRCADGGPDGVCVAR